MTDHIGKQLGNYCLLQHVGKGGFADVYLGKHVYLDSMAAIKVLHADLLENEAEKFRVEAKTLVGLNHQNIVRVLDFGIDRAIPFLVMEYVSNGTLRKQHPRGTQVPLPTIVSYVKQIAAALQYAHTQKLIHRDVKPENILLRTHDKVVLSDFGLALISQNSRFGKTQDVAGTATYTAPEQVQGKPCSASDQYSLAIVVYEWLCGTCPFHGSVSEVYGQQLYTPPPPLREKVPTIPPMVEKVVLTALAKEPKKRFESVEAFANALEQACLNELFPSAETQKVCSPPQPPNRASLVPGTINTNAVVDQFRQLLRSDSRFRILRLTGEAKTGKSHLLTKVFPAIAQEEYQAHCAIVDLRNKMYNTVPDILYMIYSQLNLENHKDHLVSSQTQINKPKGSFEQAFASCSTFGGSLKSSHDKTNLRDKHLISQCMDDLSTLNGRPLLLLFDTVNSAPKSIQAWLMDTFLVQISRLVHVRVIVAGHFLPEADGSYSARCLSYRLKQVEEMEEYIAYCKRLHVGLAEQSIRDFAHYCDYKPGLFVDCVLPKFLQRKMSNV